MDGDQTLTFMIKELYSLIMKIGLISNITFPHNYIYWDQTSDIVMKKKKQIGFAQSQNGPEGDCGYS